MREEKHLMLHDRTAHGGAELILLIRASRRVEKITRVHAVHHESLGDKMATFDEILKSTYVTRKGADLHRSDNTLWVFTSQVGRAPLKLAWV